MRFLPPLRVNVTRHDEKEQKLRDFVRQHLAMAQGAAASPHLLIVARSVDSPVVKALLGLAPELVLAGFVARLILAQLDQEALPENWEQSVGTLSCEVRWARRPRLIEAHEQLVLGPQTCWIGDCMRRDPAKCDAFENFIEDCGEAAGCATVSFERLWFASEPITRRTTPVAMAAPAMAGIDASSAPTVGTRH